MGGKGSAGVAANVQQTVGSIGYVEYAYAMQSKLVYTDMINAAGQFGRETSLPSLWFYGDNDSDTSSNIQVTNNRWSSMYYPHGGYYGSCSWNDAATTLTTNQWDDTLTPLTLACLAD